MNSDTSHEKNMVSGIPNYMIMNQSVAHCLVLFPITLRYMNTDPENHQFLVKTHLPPSSRVHVNLPEAKSFVDGGWMNVDVPIVDQSSINQN